MLGGLIELGLIGYTGYEFYIGEEKIAVLMAAISLVYSAGYFGMVTILLTTGSSSGYRGGSSGGDFDCDAGDADCGDGGGGFSGGD